METKVIIQTGNANCHDFREDCMKVIQKHFGAVDFDAIWGPIGEQFVLNFDEPHEADLFVLEWVAEMGCTFRLSKQDYRKTEWDDAYPALVIEVVSP